MSHTILHWLDSLASVLAPYQLALASVIFPLLVLWMTIRLLRGDDECEEITNVAAPRIRPIQQLPNLDYSVGGEKLYTGLPPFGSASSHVKAPGPAFASTQRMPTTAPATAPATATIHDEVPDLTDTPTPPPSIEDLPDVLDLLATNVYRRPVPTNVLWELSTPTTSVDRPPDPQDTTDVDPCGFRPRAATTGY